jgi:penicillin-binding protein 2
MISSHRIRLYLLALVILAGFGLLLYRLWGLQINRQEEFIAKLPETDKALQRIPGPRGRIFDRNGIVLADNKANLEVGLNLAEVESYWRETHPKEETPKFVWDASKDADTDIMFILNKTIFPKLDALSLYIQPTPKMIDDIRIWYRENRGVIPYPYRKSLDRTNPEDYRRFAAYAEYANELPGISLRDRSTRIYPLKALGAHYLGYIKAAGRERPPGDEANRWQFFENDDTGVEGLEKTLDADLRGKPGKRVYLKNEHGRLADEIVAEREEPLPGDDVYLTIDARIQTIAENALREAIYAPGKTGLGRGAISVVDPNTGEILALASVPSYDPNIFIPFIRQADWDALQQKKDSTVPMVSRSLSGYPPGSTFKIITAIAASMEGKGNRSYNCSGSISYGGGHAFECWKVNGRASSHGTLGLSEALKRSCNCYFYQCGNAAGIDRIEQVGKMFGVGARLPIQLNYAVFERNMPGREWWAQENKGPWTSAKTANVAIGQGEVEATPLSMSLVGAAIAAKGKVWHPTLVHHQVKHTRNRDGNLSELRTEFKPKLKADLLNMPANSASAKDLDLIRDGMWRVVNDKTGGTGKLALSEYIIAGKTGTAQKWRVDANGKTVTDHHTWFVAFAPYDDPKVAICVMVPNGKSGGGVAAPIAKRVIERTLGLADGKYQQPIAPLEPSKGHYEGTEGVKYEGEDIPVLDPSEDPTAEGMDEGDGPPVAGAPVASGTPVNAAAPRVEEGDTRAGTTESSIKKRTFRKQPGQP